MKKHRWPTWDSNPGQQNGRRRQIHWAMAAPQKLHLMFKHIPWSLVIAKLGVLEKYLLMIFSTKKKKCNVKYAYSHTSKTGMEKRLAALFDIEIHFQTQFWEDWKMLKFFSCLFLLHLVDQVINNHFYLKHYILIFKGQNLILSVVAFRTKTFFGGPQVPEQLNCGPLITSCYRKSVLTWKKEGPSCKMFPFCPLGVPLGTPLHWEPWSNAWDFFILLATNWKCILLNKKDSKLHKNTLALMSLFFLLILYLSVIYFLKMGQSRPLFVYFGSVLVTISIIQIQKSIDGVLGIWNRGSRMVGTEKTIELWWPLCQLYLSAADP